METKQISTKRALVFFLIIALIFTMLPVYNSSSQASADTTYKFTSYFISGGGDITTKFTATISGKKLNGLCTHGGPNSERSGRCEATKLSRTSDRFYLAYYYGYKKGWISGSNGCDLARAFHYAKYGYAYHQSASRSKELIENARSYCKKYGVPDNFVAFYCNPTDGSQEFVSWGYYPDGSFKLIKKSTSSQSAKTGAYTFKNIKYKIYEKKSTSSTCVGTLTLKADGTSAKISLAPNGNTAKTYYIKEYSTNSSYELNDKWYSFTISPGESESLTVKDTPKYGTLSFDKEMIINGQENVSADGFKFRLTNNNDSSVSYFAVSKDGKVKFDNVLLGTYTLTEELTADQMMDGISAVTEPQKVTISAGDNTLNSTNTFTNIYDPPTHNAVVVQKTVNDGGSAEGFRFIIENAAEGFCETKVTDESGQIGLEDVPAGEYTVTEVMTGTQKVMYVQPDSQTDTLQDGETAVLVFEFENKVKKQPLKLKKTSSDGRIEGIGFTVTGTKYAGTSIETDFEPVSVSTDANGEIDFGEFVPGKYVIEETGFDSEAYLNSYPLDGYDNPAIAFEVTEDGIIVDGELLEDNTFEFKNRSHKVTLHKKEILVDGTYTENPVAGAEYTLYQKVKNDDGEIEELLISNHVTDANGTFTIDPIEEGDFVLYETVVPAGYEEETVKETDPLTGEEIIKPKAIEFTVDADSTQIELMDTNRQSPGTVFVVKSDDAENPLEEVEFTLFTDEQCTAAAKDIDGAELVKVTDRYGFAIFENIPWGTYYLKETEALRGFEGSDEIKKAVIGYDEGLDMIYVDHEFHITNDRKTGSVELLKVDEEGNIISPEAVYELYTSEGELVKGNLRTGQDNDGDGKADGDGRIMVRDLVWGSYYFLEKEAPEGYGISDSKLRFSINAMSSSTVQRIKAVEPVTKTYVIATKKILASDIWFPNGTPTFFFELTGTNVAGEEKTYSRSVTFSEEYVRNHTDNSGYVSLSATFADIDAGMYTLSELEVSRYIFDRIETESLINGTVNDDGRSVTFRLMSEGSYGAATFINTKYESSGYSSSIMINNAIKKQAIYSGLAAEYTGKALEANMPADDLSEYLDVYAIYDDGSEEEVSAGEYTVVDVDGNKFVRTPKTPGTYTLTVTHERDGISHSAIVQIEVAPPEMITVHFETNGGTALEDIKVYKYDTLDKAVLDPSKYTPSKEEYDFNGWYKDEELAEAFSVSETPVTEEITLYAEWKTQYKNRALILEDGTMVFAYLKDSQIKTGEYNDVAIKAAYDGFDKAHYSSASEVPWSEYKDTVTSIIVADDLSPVSTAYWFSGMSNVVSADLRLLDTASTSSMTNMFEGMNELEKITVSDKFKWGTSHRLPTPTEENINYADGLWYSDKDNIGYAANSLQSYIADTYYAFPVDEVISSLNTRVANLDSELRNNGVDYSNKDLNFYYYGLKEAYIKTKDVTGEEKTISKTSGYGNLMGVLATGTTSGGISTGTATLHSPNKVLGTVGHKITGNYYTRLIPYTRYVDLSDDKVYMHVKNLHTYDATPTGTVYVLYIEK